MPMLLKPFATANYLDGKPSFEMAGYNLFKMAAVCHLVFSKFAIYRHRPQNFMGPQYTQAYTV